MVAINLDGHFEIFMVDLFKNQTVIDLKTKIYKELMLPTLQSHIVDLSRTTINEESVFTLSFDDGAFACFGKNGNMIKVTASCLFNQSVLANQEKFWARE